MLGKKLKEQMDNNGNINFLKMGNLKFPNLGGMIFLFLCFLKLLHNILRPV